MRNIGRPRLGLLLASAMVASVVVASGQVPARAAALRVCPSGCAYAQVADAVAAARDGDTISVAAGTYRGGFTIRASIRIAGAGAGATVISGGGPVITIGRFGANAEPSVSIDAVTVTGGLVHTSPESIPFAGRAGVWALGGGVEIPPNANFTGGATVTMTNSVITANKAAPSSEASGFAWAGGGGIDNWGVLVLSNTIVSDNHVGGRMASDAYGAGVLNWSGGRLTMTDSTVSSNLVTVTGPNACEAGGAGVDSMGTFTLTGGSVRDNMTEQSSSSPCGDPQGGGIYISDGSAAISGTTISGNQVSARTAHGDSWAVGGGVSIDCSGSLSLWDSTIQDNAVEVMAPATSAAASAAAGGVGVCFPGKAVISTTSITDNLAEAAAPAGVASAEGGGMQVGSTILSDSYVTDNRLVATTETGSAVVHGAGIQHGNGTLQVSDTAIHGNEGSAQGPNGEALGGGIYNEEFFPGVPRPHLFLVGSLVTDNGLTADPGVAVHGGGLYTTFRVSFTNATFSGNSPDDCFGAAC